MADNVATFHTTLAPEETIIKSIQYFSSQKWQLQNQAPRLATFAARGKVGCLMWVLTIIGLAFFVLPGLLLWVLVVRKSLSTRTITVTVTPAEGGCDVVINHPSSEASLVNGFRASLPY